MRRFHILFTYFLEEAEKANRTFVFKSLISGQTIYFLGVVVLLFIPFNPYAQKKDMKLLMSEVTDKFQSVEGNFALAFYDFQSGKSLLIRENELFHAASTMKTPVMVEVYKQAAQGKFRLSDSLVIKNEFQSIVDGSRYSLNREDDSDTELYSHIGQKATIYDLMYRMIIHSSNLATNIIIEWVGAKNVMKTIRGMGLKKMQVLRGVEDQKAYDLGMNNITTAKDLMLLFREIEVGKPVGLQASEEMIRILKDQQHNEMIPALLPDNVKVAHKTGNITGVEHDSGIVYLPDGKKYVLVILSKNLTDRDRAVSVMAEVSRLIYDFVSSK